MRKKAAKTRSLETKVIDENIPKMSLSPIAEAPLQYNPQKSFSRIDIKCSRAYTFVVPGIVFPRGRKNRKISYENQMSISGIKKYFVLIFCMLACVHEWAPY